LQAVKRDYSTPQKVLDIFSHTLPQRGGEPVDGLRTHTARCRKLSGTVLPENVRAMLKPRPSLY